MKPIAPFLFLACLMSFSHSAQAQSAVIFFDDVPVDLVQWVEAHDFHHFKTKPIMAIIDNDDPLLTHDEGQGIFSVTAPAAAQANTIYLSVKASVHLDDDDYRALIVHELVHIMQNQNGRKKFHCPGQREEEAYAMQNRFLEEQGGVAIIPLDALERLRNCPTNGFLDIDYRVVD